MRRSLSWIILGIGFWIAACPAPPHTRPVSEQAIPDPLAPEVRLPRDPQVIKGALSNELTYYIRQNSFPEKRAELRLVVNAGSVLEREDQRGLAHFTEHMAFNGTKHFEKQQLIHYLESIGMRFGADLNAYTGFDETVYMLEVPTDTDSIVEKGIQILEDWAHNLTLSEQEIEKERGVIREEWRLGRGAQGRIVDRQYPVLLEGSQYAQRLPIGLISVIDSCDHETLRDFYRGWYRPELMAVIAVGDFDVVQMEQWVKYYFSRLPQNRPPVMRPDYPVPDHSETRYSIVADPEATRTTVTVLLKRDPEKTVTVTDYRRDLTTYLFQGMLNQRLQELSRQADPPFLAAYTGRSLIVRTKNFYFLSASVKDGGVERGLAALISETQRVLQFGFTGGELERQKSQMMRAMQKQYKELDKTSSSAYAGEYIRNFLQQETIPGIEFEYRLYQRYLPDISLAEVNQLAARLTTTTSRVVWVSGPQKEDLVYPDAKRLSAVIREAERQTIAPYLDQVSDKPLIEELPPPGWIVSESRIDTLGVIRWQLSNGVTVFLKPTDFKKDEILVSAFSPGGHSLAPDQEYIAAVTSIPIVRESGLGTFSRIDLDKKIAGKIVRVSTSINETEERLSGSASPEDLETLFELIHLSFTAPRYDSIAFATHRAVLEASLNNKSADPVSVYKDTLRVTLAQRHFRARPWSIDLLTEMNLERSLAFYRDRYADASDFTFIFVGSFKLEQIRPYILNYLAGLPVLNRQETWRDVGQRPPSGVVKKAVYRGIESKSYVNLTFTGLSVYNQVNRLNLYLMTEVLRIQLRERIREDEGGTYGVRIQSRLLHYPREEYSVEIEFGCNPDRVEDLVRAVREEITQLQHAGPASANLVKVKEIYRRQRELQLKENGFWLSALDQYLSNGEDPRMLLETMRLVDSTTIDNIRAAAGEFLRGDQYIQVVLYPENAR